MKKRNTLNVLLAYHREYHPGPVAGKIVKALLERQGFARCDLVERQQALSGSVTKYDVVVLYCVTRELAAVEERSLCAFVKNGGGLIGVHAASGCSPKNRAYLKMLGVRFVDHDPGLHTWG